MGRTIVHRNFEWDAEKAWRNRAKHKVSFEEAATVFDDPYFFAYKDLKHSAHEDCYVIIGTSERNRFLTVAFTERKRTRLISARKSNEMKQNSTRKKSEKPSELDKVDPLDDVDPSQLKLVARGRGWSINPEEGKRRARKLTAAENHRSRVKARKRRA